MIGLGEGHGLRTGDAVKYTTGSGAAIGGLTDGTTYYLIVLDDEHAELAASRADAASGKAIKLTSAGSSSQKFSRRDAIRSAPKPPPDAGGGDTGVAGIGRRERGHQRHHRSGRRAWHGRLHRRSR